jgi:hypothetical protein
LNEGSLSRKPIAESIPPPLTKDLPKKRRKDVISTSPEYNHTSQIEESPEDALPMQYYLELSQITRNRERRLTDIQTLSSREAPDDVVIGRRRSERLRRRRYTANSSEQANIGVQMIKT